MDHSQPSISETTLRLIEDPKALEAALYLGGAGCQGNDFQALLGYVLHLDRTSGDTGEKSNRPIPEVSIFIGASISSGLGGWGVYIQSKGGPTELKGVDENTTLPRMNLRAAIEALESLKEPSKVRLLTKEKTLVQTMNEWLPAWLAQGGRKADGKRVANWDLIERLEKARESHEVSFEVAQENADLSNIARACFAADRAITN